MFEGPSNSGKLDVALSAADEHVRGGDDHHAVIITYRRGFMESLELADNITVFSVDEGATDTELYLTPRSGLLLAQTLRQQGKDVLLVMDGVQDYQTAE